ncbi:OLC1v1027492C1 [Oldenlandia corymbosa var. corymbosa]|uniref:non-specific serine/threonine protein kinase n=1 Tax=Oldenlandia corymbosa var. corymbosa TaxID=529605 RepID=A0AAV1C9L7_OLDCO|nr:OLC1v1027492C1 [Oldenlandia corymbosa var. corymbosa]
MSLISSIHDKLLKPTSFFGVKLWVAIVICIATGFVLALSITICCFSISQRRRPRRDQYPSFSTKHVITSKKNSSVSPGMMNKRLLSRNGWDIEMCIDTKPGKQVAHYDPRAAVALPVRHQRTPSSFGKVYSLHEMEVATNWFGDDCVMGSGDYGVVYRGYLFDHTRVAIKKLLANSARTKDLAAEVELLWCMRHKNVVKLLGYCTEGMFSLLVSEYVDNGNLKEWLHEKMCKLSPLTWKIRMGIIQGIAKGCDGTLCHYYEFIKELDLFCSLWITPLL